VPIGSILGTANTVFPYVQKVQTLYNLFNQYVLGNKPPSELDQIKSLIEAAQTQIDGQIDGDFAAVVDGDVATVVEQFKNIDTMSGADLDSFVLFAVNTVEQAKSQLKSETTPGTLDELGFDLNIAGPIALAASAKDNQDTSSLVTDLIDANFTVLQKLKPTCGVYPFDLSFTGSRLATGDCFAYDYHGGVPTGALSQVPEGFSAVGLGHNFWNVTGDYNGFRFAAPTVTDYSQAIATAVAATSYPIAQAALLGLQPHLTPWGGPIAVNTETVTNQTYAPIGVFGVQGQGSLFNTTLAPTVGQSGNATLQPWGTIDSAKNLTSVASAINSDGREEVFATDTIGQLLHRWQAADGVWLLWAQMDSGNFRSVTVARNRNGALQVFATNVYGEILTSSQVMTSDTYPVPAGPRPAADTWTPWVQIDGWNTQAVAVTNPAGRIELFGLGGSGVLYHREERLANANDPSVAGNWTGWAPVNNAPASLREISGTTNSAGQIFLVGINNSNQMFDVLKTNDLGQVSDYTAWGRISGTMQHVAIAGEAGSSGSIQMIGSDSGGNIFRNHLDGAAAGSPATPNPAAGWTALDGRVSPYGS
jgi:hypothetical protein